MTKSNFLLVDLNEAKTKKLAETITSDTSRKILNFLVEKNDSEQNIAKSLNIPISTVHYHLQKLQEAGLVIVKEFHYSEKGREVNHYQLANKYIIIAPKNVSGLRKKLRGILPGGLVILGISAIIKLLTSSSEIFSATPPTAEMALKDSVESLAASVPVSAPMEAIPSPDIALWFLLGGVSMMILYLAYQVIMENIKK
ncbi:MAG: winged helix-turn-helix domain-containing protein [archaeon]|nr:winged helix-turn-helix domain-containing protein [archaeon]